MEGLLSAEFRESPVKCEPSVPRIDSKSHISRTRGRNLFATSEKKLRVMARRQLNQRFAETKHRLLQL
jgi:hypothetical protein